MELKELNKLAKACRRLGIKHLKTDEFELELSSDILPAQVKKRKTLAPVNESLFNEPDATSQHHTALKELSDTDLLFWSTGEGTQ